MTRDTTDLPAPVASQIDFGSGRLEPAHSRIERRLTDMTGAYLQEPGGDALVYEVYNLEAPEENCNLLSCTTVLHAGKVGREYHMTKGHFHEVRNRAEVYVGVSGKGALVMGSEDGDSEVQWIRPGSVHYIPGGWAHRTVNVGDDKLVFYAVWIADAGHDYGTIEERGFPVLILDNNGTPEVVPNPRYPG